MKKLDSDGTQLSDLRALLALLEEGTVTRAARRLGLSQSALSYQLERMRRRFSDALFVRVGNRMAPTPLAQGLAEPAARVLRIMDTEIAGGLRFDPATTDREFRIGLNEMGAITLLPRLARRLAQVAPRARLSPLLVDPQTLGARLESGEMEVAAGHFPGADSSLLQQLLYRRDYVCVASASHPRVGERVGWKEFAALPQVQTRGVPSTNAWLEAQLRRRSLQGNVRISMAHISAVPFIVASSELLAVMPREVHALFDPVAPMKVVRLPAPIPVIDIRQYWHPRLAGDPAVRFFRELVYAAAHEA